MYLFIGGTTRHGENYHTYQFVSSRCCEEKNSFEFGRGASKSTYHSGGIFDLSLYEKKPLPEFRLWIVGKNGMLIFS